MAIEQIDREATLAGAAPREAPRMHIVIGGHVDHGKSTVIGRLLADTGSLPDGKLDAIRASERADHGFQGSDCVVAIHPSLTCRRVEQDNNIVSRRGGAEVVRLETEGEVLFAC